MRLLAHPLVSQHRLDDLDRQKQQGGRDDHHAGALSLLHHRIEMLVDLGKDRFRRHEKKHGILCFAGNQVFFRDVPDMNVHISPELLGRSTPCVGRGGLAKRSPRFEREFGVDHQRWCAVRHADHAIRSRSVGKRRLEGISPVRQAVGHDRLHPALAECPARLLVGKDRLQTNDILGQRLDIVLCRIDDGQPLLQLTQVFMRRFGLFGNRRAQPVGHAIEPLVDGMIEFGLTAGDRLGHGGDTPVHLALHPHQFGQARFRIHRALRHLFALAAAAKDGEKRDDDRQNGENCSYEQDW
ncbi:hypothetical protein D3C73_794790 [compost metagenome]